MAKWTQADRFAQVKARLEALKANKKIMAKLRRQQADTECRKWMSLARNYTNAGLKEKARLYLHKIIKNHGGTTWAEQARQILAEIEAGDD